MKNEDIFYGQDTDEQLFCTEKHEAISAILDSEPSPLPESIELCEYKRDTVTIPLTFDEFGLIEGVLESLDEEYGSPEGGETIFTDEMKMECRVFINKICSLYVPWSCTVSRKMDINCKKWVTENAPNWIKDGVTFEEDDKE